MKLAFSRRALGTVLSWLFVGGLALWGFWPSFGLGDGGEKPRTIVFYGFSILGETFHDAIFPAFAKQWRERTGESVEFISSFSGSGTVTNQIIMGVPAELALLSLETDADRIAAAGVLPAGSWRSLPHRGVVNRTPFVILVRPGNPKAIGGFDDLTRPGVGVIHPDPLTSGGANWAILAEYGSGLRHGGPDVALARLEGIWLNVAAQAASARAARTQFEQGFGDALITYEQEALADRAKQRLSAEVVYPKSTILSEHTLVVVDRNVSADNRKLVDAFVEFLWSDEAQRLFVANGFRSVDPAINAARTDLVAIEDAFLVEDLGGWQRARSEIIERIWKQRVLPLLGKKR